MKMNSFDYLGASDKDLISHLIAEIKDIMTDPVCQARTCFDTYEERHTMCGTYRCTAGWMAFRSNIPVLGKFGFLTREFSQIFRSRFVVAFSSVQCTEPGYTTWWDMVFGSHTENYAFRLAAAEKFQALSA